MFKRIIVSMGIGLVLSGTLLGVTALKDVKEVKDSVLRLHIVANSDSREDQELKLFVRDEILSESEILFEGAENKEQAMIMAQENAEKLREAAINAIHKGGYEYDAQVVIGKQFFPTKDYDGFRLPAGEYDAVKVLIGSGEGKNWWCVMYPPLCFSGSVKNTNKVKMDDVLGDEGIKFVSYPAPPKVEVKFKVAEMFGEVVNFFKKK